MKNILIVVFLLVSQVLYGQYPINPRNPASGYQTSGEGLFFRGSGTPTYTPTDSLRRHGTFMHVDTVGRQMFVFTDTLKRWAKIYPVTLDSISNIQITSPANNSFLVYNSGLGKWQDTVLSMNLSSTGSESASQVAFFLNSNLITGDTGFVWNNSLKQLNVSGKGRFQDTLFVKTKRVLTTDDIGASKSLLDTLPIGNVTIDANGNTFRLDSLANFTAMYSSTAGITKGRTNTTTFIGNPYSDINNGFFANQFIGSYLHWTDGSSYGTVNAYQNGATLTSRTGPTTSSYLSAWNATVDIQTTNSTGITSQIELNDDTLTIDADTAVLINGVKMPTAAAPLDNFKYGVVWKNNQPTMYRQNASITLTVGSVSVVVTYTGSSQPTLTGSAGVYTLTVPLEVEIHKLTVTGNSNTLTPSNEFVFQINNAANASTVWFMTQVYDVNSGAYIDADAYGINHIQTVLSNVTKLEFPNMNYFGTTGFRILMR